MLGIVQILQKIIGWPGYDITGSLGGRLSSEGIWLNINELQTQFQAANPGFTCDRIIFNNGSGGGRNQTADLTIPSYQHLTYVYQYSNSKSKDVGSWSNIYCIGNWSPYTPPPLLLTSSHSNINPNN